MVIKKGAFWRNASNWLDIVIWAANVAVTTLYLVKRKVVTNVLDQVNQNPDDFVRYFRTEYYTELYNVLIAILMFISVMGTWRFLRFGYAFRVFERTVATFTLPLISAFIYSTVFYFQYIVIGHLLFGSYAAEFSTVTVSITVVTLLGLGQYKRYNHDEVAHLDSVIYRLFYTSYAVVFLYFLKLHIAIISSHHKDSVRYVLQQHREFSILTYFLEECKYHYIYITRHFKRLTSGEDDPKKLTNLYMYQDQKPKVTKRINDAEVAASILYVPSNKLEMMAVLLFANLYNQSVRKEKGIVTECDMEIMHSIVWHHRHVNEGENLAFYQMALSETRSHFVTKETLDNMDVIANLLFEPERLPPKHKPKKPVDKISLKKLEYLVQRIRNVEKSVNSIDIVIRL